MMRSAASMLELIVAIVVMGIAVMTLPMLLTQTQNNNAYTMQQEVILAARTKLGDTLTYRWDENSIQNDTVRVLTTDGDSDLNVSSDGIRRIGHVKGDKRRKFFTDLNASTSPANLGPDSGDLDDIDDFNSATPSQLQLPAQNTNLDYHFKDFNLTTSVVYVSDTANYNANDINFVFGTTASGTSTNIKLLTLSVTGNNETPFTLRTYSCNIGESTLLRKAY
ncbi:type IV pilus modification PilV family protein [Sulfurospirillum sp. 1612]|uniref:type IV pilus modification PilV family protein n=1 Tax=Sulfurospirillum sp. 1612 TaxID=3094835 RepID=UPI002F940266